MPRHALPASLSRLAHAQAPPAQTFTRSMRVDINFTPYDTLRNRDAGRLFQRACRAGLDLQLLRYFRRNLDQAPRAILLYLPWQPTNLLERKLNRVEQQLIARWGRHAPWGLLDEGRYVCLVNLPQREHLLAISTLLTEGLAPTSLFTGRLTLHDAVVMPALAAPPRPRRQRLPATSSAGTRQPAP